MNNSQIVLDNLAEPQDTRSSLAQQQGELTQLVEAINRVEASDEWKKVRTLLLDGVVSRLEKEIINLASKPDIDTNKLYRLQGELHWARKYTNLRQIADEKRKIVETINNQLYDNPRDGAL